MLLIYGAMCQGPMHSTCLECLFAGIIDELAHLTETIERQGLDHHKIPVDIFHQLKGEPTGIIRTLKTPKREM